ncbi:hypothetical protein T484DRAFT_1769187 [Baffinella frigidus]|nr:hypothetical protein T484DRAFT_1769187 [Cryptophyta sp. CCMP2293]
MSGAQKALQAQVDELLGNLPKQVVSLSPEVKPAALEWLKTPGLETEAFYVSATIQGLDEHYSRAYRVRFVVGGSYSMREESRPPMPQFLDNVDSLVVGEEGRMKLEIFDTASDWTEPENAPSLQRSLLYAGAVLQGSPPESLFENDPGTTAAWQREASENRQRESVMTRYAQQCLTPPLFDASLVRFQDFLSPSLLAAVAALQAGDGGAKLRSLATEEIPGVFSFEMFQEHFCEKLIAELENFEKSGLPL